VAVSDGDGEFAAFASVRYAALVRAGYLLTADRWAAEDLVQAALLRAYPAWQRGAPDHPEAYVRKIMVRLAIRAARRKRVREVPLDAAADRAVDSPERIDRQDLQQALLSLAVPQRAVLVLRYLEGLSEADTAHALGCSVGTVKSRASRALAALREHEVFTESEVGHD
jgi:RNA polymerase sigma-70 factor (sigma-E family)